MVLVFCAWESPVLALRQVSFERATRGAGGAQVKPHRIRASWNRTIKRKRDQWKRDNETGRRIAAKVDLAVRNTLSDAVLPRDVGGSTELMLRPLDRLEVSHAGWDRRVIVRIDWREYQAAIEGRVFRWWQPDFRFR